MKNRTDRDELLDDLLGGDLRATSLAHTLAAARGARRMRSVKRGIAIAAAVVLGPAALLLFRPMEKQPSPVVAQSPSAIRLISDDELLERFPGRAVALVGPPERRQLVFLDVKPQAQASPDKR